MKKYIALLFTFCMVVICSIIIYHWMSTTEVEMLSQTHIKLIIDNNQIVDYRDFINPKGSLEVLNNIDISIRLQIADYMKENNLKLKAGNHYVRKRVMSDNNDIGTLEEHLKYFNFEKIDT